MCEHSAVHSKESFCFFDAEQAVKCKHYCHNGQEEEENIHWMSWPISTWYWKIEDNTQTCLCYALSIHRLVFNCYWMKNLRTNVYIHRTLLVEKKNVLVIWYRGNEFYAFSSSPKHFRIGKNQSESISIVSNEHYRLYLHLNFTIAHSRSNKQIRSEQNQLNENDNSFELKLGCYSMLSWKIIRSYHCRRHRLIIYFSRLVMKTILCFWRSGNF